MASIVISGDTSGAVTLAAPAVAGTTTLTLPTTTGTLVVTSGAQTIEFAAGSAASPSITFTGDTNTGIFSPAADTIAFAEGGVEAMRIDSSGRLLINTSSARTTLDGDRSALVQIEGLSVDQSMSMFRNENNAFGPTFWIGKSRGTTAGSNTVVQNGDGLGSILFLGSDGTKPVQSALISAQVDGTPGTNDMPGRLVFYTTADGASSVTERMRITSAGFLKASNTGAYYSATDPFHELRSNQNNNLAIFTNTQSTGNVYGPYIAFTGQSPNNTTSYFLECADSVARLTIYSNGTINNSTGTYAAYSDIKLKQDVVDAGSQWNDIKAVRVRKFRLKNEVAVNSDAKPFIGVIAQELETTSAGLIDDTYDKEGVLTKSVKYSILYMKAVKALQEAMERIETLEAKVTALENK